jgi:hypothetical protein
LATLQVHQVGSQRRDLRLQRRDLRPQQQVLLLQLFVARALSWWLRTHDEVLYPSHHRYANQGR